MRAKLLPHWPALAEFGIHPWNFDRLSVAELDIYLEALADRRWHARQ